MEEMIEILRKVRDLAHHLLLVLIRDADRVEIRSKVHNRIFQHLGSHHLDCCHRRGGFQDDPLGKT